MKDKKESADDVANVNMSRSRIKPMGRVGLLKMEDIPPEHQHLYREWHGKLYHIGNLSPEVLKRMDGDGVKCDLGMRIGGNFRSLRDGVAGTES